MIIIKKRGKYKNKMRIYGIGGFNEVGKNMTAVDLGEDVILFDGGLFLPPILELEETERAYTEKRLRSIGAIPADTILDQFGLRNKVRAIIPSHAHLDHIGALPYLAQRYNADIIGTPFTIEVLKTILKDEKMNLRNKLKIVQPNSFCYIQGKNKKYKIDELLSPLIPMNDTDLILGLELLETIRNLKYISKKTVIILNTYKNYPRNVFLGLEKEKKYPSKKYIIELLNKSSKRIFSMNFNELSITRFNNSIYLNMIMLGVGVKVFKNILLILVLGYMS